MSEHIPNNNQEARRIQKALAEIASSPEVVAAAKEMARQVAQTLPKSLQTMRENSVTISEHYKRAEEDIRRGAQAKTPSGKRPSGRII